MIARNVSAPSLFTRREACQILRIGISQYKKLIERGALREIAIGERGRRLPESEIERFIREQLEN